jgi:hypothetical protein
LGEIQRSDIKADEEEKKSRISNRSSTPLLNISPVLLYSYEKHFLKRIRSNSDATRATADDDD